MLKQFLGENVSRRKRTQKGSFGDKGGLDFKFRVFNLKITPWAESRFYQKTFVHASWL